MPKTRVTIPFFIPHLGCKHRCVFCNQVFASNTITPPDEHSMIQKIEYYLQHVKPTVDHIEIAFFGGNFTGLGMELQKKYLATAYRYYRRKSIDGIRISTRPDSINLEMLALLNDYAVTTIELGAQSMHDDVLSLSNRGHTSDDVITASTLIKECGYHLIIQLMPGLPGDTHQKSIASAHEVIKLNPDGVRIYPTIVLKRTQLEKLYVNGSYAPLSFDDAIVLCSELFALFHDSSIPVIRIGVHPFNQQYADAIIAGPYHPQFGYHVKSRYFRNKLQSLIEGIVCRNDTGTLQVQLPQRNSAEYAGHSKENIEFLRNHFCNITFKFTINEVAEPTVTVG